MIFVGAANEHAYTGAFRLTDVFAGAGSGGGKSRLVEFLASLQTSIFGGSTTIQPASARHLYIIKA